MGRPAKTTPIFDRLDQERVGLLINLIQEDMFDQVFITDTNKKRMSHLLGNVNRSFSIFDIE